MIIILPVYFGQWVSIGILLCLKIFSVVKSQFIILSNLSCKSSVLIFCQSKSVACNFAMRSELIAKNTHNAICHVISKQRRETSIIEPIFVISAMKCADETFFIAIFKISESPLGQFSLSTSSSVHFVNYAYKTNKSCMIALFRHVTYCYS